MTQNRLVGCEVVLGVTTDRSWPTGAGGTSAPSIQYGALIEQTGLAMVTKMVCEIGWGGQLTPQLRLLGGNNDPLHRADAQADLGALRAVGRHNPRYVHEGADGGMEMELATANRWFDPVNVALVVSPSQRWELLPPIRVKRATVP